MDYFVLNIIMILFLGFVVGRIMRHAHLQINADKYLIFFVAALLFLIGVKLGNSEMVIQSLTLLGLESLVLALVSILGSAIVAYIITRYIK
ncbi:MAG: LysO family transporter [Thermoprotei archaeon]